MIQKNKWKWWKILTDYIEVLILVKMSSQSDIENIDKWSDEIDKIDMVNDKKYD